MKGTFLSLTVLALFSVPAFAGSATASLSVAAKVKAICTISSLPVNFGDYDSVGTNATTDLTGTGTVIVACTKGTAATIDLGNGGYLSGGSRRMSSGGDFLNYSLYKDSTRTQVWGSGLSSGTTALYNALSKASASILVYGTVPQGQDVTVSDNYTDTVQATINY